MGAVRANAPLLEDDIYMHSNSMIAQLDGNITLDTLSLNQTICNSTDYPFEATCDVGQQAEVKREHNQTWKKSVPQHIPVILTTSYKNYGNPPAWFEPYFPRKMDKNE